MEKDLLKDFDFLKCVENEVFNNRFETKRYIFDDNKRNLVVSEIKLMIDTIHGPQDNGVQFQELQVLF